MGEEFQRIPVGPVGVGQRKEIAAPGGAGVVDQDIEPAELALRRLDQRPCRGVLAQIDHADRGLAAPLADRSRYRVERGGVPSGDQEVASFVRKRQGDAAADAAARTRHQGGFSPQPELHPRFLLRAPPWRASFAELSHWPASG